MAAKKNGLKRESDSNLRWPGRPAPL